MAPISLHARTISALTLHLSAMGWTTVGMETGQMSSTVVSFFVFSDSAVNALHSDIPKVEHLASLILHCPVLCLVSI